jgi:hypothetical protein
MHLRPGLQQQLSMQWEGGWQQVVQALLGGVGGAAAAADGPLGFSAGLHYQLHIILVTYWAAECRWAGWLSVTGGYSEDVSTD